MANIIARGKATVNGVTGAIDVMIYPVQQKIRASQMFEEEAGKDVTGFTAWLLARDEKAEGTYGVKFVGDTAAHAKTPVTSAGLLGQPFFAPYTSLTFSGFDMAVMNGVWQIISGTELDMENVKVADGDYKVRKWADATQNTLLNTVPS